MTARTEAGTYSFDAFLLDTGRGAVLGPDGAELRLRPKAFALLRHLLEHPGRLLGREELLDALWPGVAVTDDSLTQCVSDLRHAFGDRAAHVLRTVPKRGYVMTAEVRHDAPPRPSTPVPVPVRDTAAHRRDPVAVYRFEAPDGDRACMLLADAVVTDLIAAGTRLGGLNIRLATDTVVGEGYRIRGEVRAVGEELRVTIRLEDGATAIALWADRLTQSRNSPLGLSEPALSALGANLTQQVERQSLMAARRKPVAGLSARELVLIGRDHHQRGTEVDTRVAKETFARAIEIDPDYAPAYAWQAYTVHRAVIHGWGSPGGQDARDESLRLARRAVQIEPDAPLCLARLAFSLVLHQRWDEAVLAARAALNSGRPAFAAARNTCCEVLTHAGHPEEAVEIAQGTLAMNPLTLPTTYAIIGRALLLDGKAEEALLQLRSCASRLPDYVWTYDSLVVAAAESGRISEAWAARRELLRLMPSWVPRNHTGLWFFRRPEDLDRFQAAYLRTEELAGALGEQHATPATGYAGSKTDHDASTVASPAPHAGPEYALGLAGLRQETVMVHPSQAATEDLAALRAGYTLISDLTAELVRYEDLRVVTGPDERVAQGFTVRSDLHSAGEQLHALVRLEDLATGTSLWAKRLEIPSGQAIGFDSASTMALAATIDVQIGRNSLHRARQKSLDILTARDATWLGKEHYHRSSEAETTAARQMFARASALDPGYAPAHAWHALALARSAVQDWRGPDSSGAIERAIQLARRAVELEPESPLALASQALSLAVQGLWEEAVASARLALGSVRVAGEGPRIAAGDVLLSAGYPGEAEEALRYAVARDPHCSPVVHSVLGRALVLGGRAEEAVRVLRRCAAQMPGNALSFRTMAVAAVEADLIEDAQEAMRQVVRLRPEWVRDEQSIFWFLRRDEDITRFRRAFRIAAHLDAAAKTGGLMDARASSA